MWWYETTKIASETQNSIEIAIAKKLCRDPEAAYIAERNTEQQELEKV